LIRPPFFAYCYGFDLLELGTSKNVSNSKEQKAKSEGDEVIKRYGTNQIVNSN
jgi:hypothetical protein